MSVILKAAQFAHRAHVGQLRKGPGQVPYFVHLARVAGRVASLDDSTPEMVAAAFLHDTLEDTDVTLPDLVKEFPSPIPDYVRYLTQPTKTFGLNRAQRNTQYFQALSQAPLEVKVIKLCDRIDNLRDMLGFKRDFQILYAQESELLLAILGSNHEELEVELKYLIRTVLIID